MCCSLFLLLCSAILEDIDISEMAKALWEAPFAVLSHDKFENEDPVFTYANKVCLQKLLQSWSTMQLPSQCAGTLYNTHDMQQTVHCAGCVGLV